MQPKIIYFLPRRYMCLHICLSICLSIYLSLYLLYFFFVDFYLRLPFSRPYVRGHDVQHRHAGPGAHPLQRGHHDHRPLAHRGGLPQGRSTQAQVPRYRGRVRPLLPGRGPTPPGSRRSLWAFVSHRYRLTRYRIRFHMRQLCRHLAAG